MHGVTNNPDPRMPKLWLLRVLYLRAPVLAGLFCDSRGIDVKRCSSHQLNSLAAELGQLSHVDKK